MTRSALRLVDFPRALDHDDYRAASEEIERFLQDLPGFVALYRLGSVRHAGISDLDRIAVVEMGDPVVSIWPHLSPDARYVAMHGPFLVDLETFRSRRWFTHLTGLELVGGEDVPVDEPIDPARCDLHLAAEGLTLLTLKLVQQARTGRVKVRSTLCEFHAMRFSLVLAGLDERLAPEAWRFVHAVRATRDGWFASPEHRRPELMTSLMQRAPSALLDSLLAIDAQLGEAADSPRRMALGSPWDSTTLVATEPALLGAAYTRILRYTSLAPVIGGSRRAGALRWRMASTPLPIPPAVLGLLSETRRAATPLHQTRQRVISSYARFLATRGQGFSQIGLGGPFA